MKDTEVIQKIQLLQSVQPDRTALQDVRIMTLQRLHDNEQSISKRQYRFPLFASLIVAACVVISLVIIIVSGNILLLPAKIAFASNQYEKAQIAFVYTNSHYSSVTMQSNTHDEEKFSYSLQLTNTEMSKLKLMGEKGKYSRKQCQELYTAYHEYLEMLEKKTNTQQSLLSDTQRSVLAQQIKQYDDQAEKKLHNYHN